VDEAGEPASCTRRDRDVELQMQRIDDEVLVRRNDVAVGATPLKGHRDSTAEQPAS
jgi:hypothetical protein